MQNQNSKTEFENYLKFLFAELTDIDSYFELWIHLNNKREDRLDVMNLAPAFFQLTIHALFTTCIVTLSKFFEARSDKNINRFLNYVESNISIFSNEKDILKKHNCKHMVDIILIRNHRRKIQDLQPILDKLKVWRDKSFVHHDNKYFRNRVQLGKDYSIKVRDIRLLIDSAAQILNDYSCIYDASTNVIRSSNLLDIDNILEILHRSKAQDNIF